MVQVTALAVVALSLVGQSSEPAATAEPIVPPPEEVADDVFDVVDEYVSTASRAEDPIRLAPASITVLYRQEIEDFAHVTVADALTGTRGFFQTNDYTYPTLGVRGVQPFGSFGNRIQVQLDGHILNEDWVGQSAVAFDLLSDLGMLDRIEAVRGPGSVLFGTGAMLGVVNLVTPSKAPGYIGRAKASWIFPNTARFAVDTGAQLDNGPGFWLAVGGVGGGSFDLAMPSYEGTSWAPDGVARDVGALQSMSVMARAWWSDFTLQLYSHGQQHQLAAANFSTILGDQRTREDTQRSFVELRWEPRLTDDIQLLARVYSDSSGFFGVYPYADPEYGTGTESFNSVWYGAEARTLLTLIPQLRLAVGAEAQTHPGPKTYGEASLPEPTPYIDEVTPYHRGSLYANADWDPSTWLRVSAGARFDAWVFENLGDDARARFIPSVNPRVAVIWMPTDVDTVKLMGGSAFRVPSVQELTYNDGDYTQQRSPDLEPETIYTAELEYSRLLPMGVRGIAALHASTLLGLIQQIGEGEEGDLLRYINEEDPTWTGGAELAVERALAGDVFVRASYGWASARRADPIAGARLENAPEHLVGIKAAWHGLGPAGHLSTRVQVESPRLDREGGETDPVVIWDATLSGTVEALHFDYAVGARNILDARVVHPVGGDIQELVLPQPGRGLIAEVRFHL